MDSPSKVAAKHQNSTFPKAGFMRDNLDLHRDLHLGRSRAFG